MYDVLLILYAANAVFLILHEMDSAYRKEWELFRLPGGITGFLLLHIPLLGIVLYGLLLVAWQSAGGIYFSLLLSLSGIFAFTIHSVFQKKGDQSFSGRTSRAILYVILLISAAQLFISCRRLFA